VEIGRGQKEEMKAAQAWIAAPLDETQRDGYHNAPLALLHQITRLVLENLITNFLHHLSIPDGIDPEGLGRPTPPQMQVAGIRRRMLMLPDFLAARSISY
jgi:hypothetical protein